MIFYPKQPKLTPVLSTLFSSLDIRICTGKSAILNTKAKIPSLKVVANFGEGFEDLKQCSAQLTDNYEQLEETPFAADGRKKSSLIDNQFAAITNFPKRHVGIPSDFLILGVVSLEGETLGTSVLQPCLKCKEGTKIQLLNSNEVVSVTRSPLVAYASTFHLLDIRLGTVVSTSEKLIDFGEDYGTYNYKQDYIHFKDGIQVLRVFNLIDKMNEDNILGILDDNGVEMPLVPERAMPNGRFLK